LPAEKESFEHFFWYCPTTSRIISRFFQEYINVPIDKTLFFTGAMYTDTNQLINFQKPVLIVFSLLRYCLWNFKLRKKLPTWHGITSEFFYHMHIMSLSSKKFYGSVLNCNWLKSRPEEN
jgi:hypothetical protein